MTDDKDKKKFYQVGTETGRFSSDKPNVFMPRLGK